MNRQEQSGRKGCRRTPGGSEEDDCSVESFDFGNFEGGGIRGSIRSFKEDGARHKGVLAEVAFRRIVDGAFMMVLWIAAPGISAFKGGICYVMFAGVGFLVVEAMDTGKGLGGQENS